MQTFINFQASKPSHQFRRGRLSRLVPLASGHWPPVVKHKHGELVARKRHILSHNVSSIANASMVARATLSITY